MCVVLRWLFLQSWTFVGCWNVYCEKVIYTVLCGIMMSEKGFVRLSSSWVHSVEHQRVVENLEGLRMRGG
jgi:hypothetical protein